MPPTSQLPPTRYYNVSRLNEAKQCMQKYANYFELGLTPARIGHEGELEKPEATFGSAIHVGLQAMYQGQDWEWATLASFPDGYEPSAKYSHNHETPDYAIRLLKAYRERYSEDFKSSTIEVLGVEREIEVKIQPGIVLMGRLDLIVRLPFGGSGGTVYHMQHKTMSMNTSPPTYAREYDLAWHERLYVMALKQLYPRENVGGTYLNLLRKSKRISKDVDFLRYFVPVSQELIERFKWEAIELIGDIERHREAERWPQNPQHCLKYGQLCVYHNRCLGAMVDEWGIREPDYVDKRRSEVGSDRTQDHIGK